MQPLRITIAAVGILAAQIQLADAALPPRSPEELESVATLIVCGTVLDVQVADDGSGNSVDRVFTLRAKIDKVEKGDAAKPDDTIAIRCWRVKKRPDGWAGPAGHFSIPAQEAKFRMWLTGTDEDTWQPLQPNGIELLDGSQSYQEANRGDAQDDSAEDEAGEISGPAWMGPVLVFVVLGSILFFMAIGSKGARGATDGDGGDGGGDGGGE